PELSSTVPNRLPSSMKRTLPSTGTPSATTCATATDDCPFETLSGVSTSVVVESTGPLGSPSVTVTATRTCVPDGAAVSTSTVSPTTSSGTVSDRLAAPSVTGASSKDAAEPSHSTATLVLSGLPSEARSRPAPSSVSDPPCSTVCPARGTWTARRAKLGTSGLWAETYAIHASRSSRPESRVSVPSRNTRKLSPPWSRKLNVPTRYSPAGSTGAPSTHSPVIRSPAGASGS